MCTLELQRRLVARLAPAVARDVGRHKCGSWLPAGRTEPHPSFHNNTMLLRHNPISFPAKRHRAHDATLAALIAAHWQTNTA